MMWLLEDVCNLIVSVFAQFKASVAENCTINRIFRVTGFYQKGLLIIFVAWWTV